MALPTLSETHSALSHLVHAVRLALEPLSVDVIAQWRSSTYLSVEIACAERDKQRVVDALTHGALHDTYDYRFQLSYSTSPTHPDDWVRVTAYPDLFHPRKDRP